MLPALARPVPVDCCWQGSIHAPSVSVDAARARRRNPGGGAGERKPAGQRAERLQGRVHQEVRPADDHRNGAGEGERRELDRDRHGADFLQPARRAAGAIPRSAGKARHRGLPRRQLRQGQGRHREPLSDGDLEPALPAEQADRQAGIHLVQGGAGPRQFLRGADGVQGRADAEAAQGDDQVFRQLQGLRQPGTGAALQARQMKSPRCAIPLRRDGAAAGLGL